MCVLLCLSMFAACNGGSGDSGSAGGGDSDKTWVIKIASDETIDTPCSVATLEFKKLVEERSEGRLKVDYFNDSAMGDEREIAESVNMGTLEMGIISGCYLSTYAPDWYLVDLPYVFLDRPIMYGYLDGEVGDLLRESISANSNIEVLDFADGSFKILMHNSTPITKVSDLQRMKFRCQESQMNMAIYKAWNSTAIPMGFSEIYMALQQGTVDGVDTTPLYQRSGGFYEVGKKYTMTNHQVLLMTSLVNKSFIASLPEDLQKVIRDASYEAYSVYEREIVQEAEQYAKTVFDDAGCEEYVLSDAERQTFIDASKAVIEEYRSTINPVLYELIGL